MNEDVRILGDVHAWYEAGQRYSATSELAPEHAVEAKLVELQGQIVLAMYDGQRGQNVWGAVQLE
jgi:hypothetical protein